MKNIKELELTILDEAEMAELIGLNSDDIDQLEYQFGFPRPIEICGQIVGWSEKEVMEWMWIRAIEASWGSRSRWKGEAYSSLRHPSNMLSLSSELLNLVKADLREFLPSESKELVRPEDPFGDVLEMARKKRQPVYNNG